MVVFKKCDCVPSARYSIVCNVLHQWSISLIPTYRVYRLYDIIVCTLVYIYILLCVHWSIYTCTLVYIYILLCTLIYIYILLCVHCVLYIHIIVYMVYRDSYRILGLGGETQHLGGSGDMFHQEFFLKTNALRLILGHFLVHMHILANTLHSSKRLCILL